VCLRLCLCFSVTAVTDRRIRTELDLVKCYQFCVTQCRVLGSNVINEHLFMTYSATDTDQGAMQRCIAAVRKFPSIATPQFDAM